MAPSLPATYFEQLYSVSDDPWKIAVGWYEARKRRLILASLPRDHYSLVFEPGCSNAELTRQLATRTDRLIGWDVDDSAVSRARRRTADLPHVEIHRAALPKEWPDESADLIVFAEVGYYLDEVDLDRAVDGILDHLCPGGTLVAVHWRHAAPDYPLTGDGVHERIGSDPRLTRLGGYDDVDFLLDVWTSGPGSSVAADSGVLDQS